MSGNEFDLPYIPYITNTQFRNWIVKLLFFLLPPLSDQGLPAPVGNPLVLEGQ